jgi:hypothetical protein
MLVDQYVREVLAERIHAALGRDDFGAANDDERDEMFDVVDAVFAELTDLGFTTRDDNFVDPTPWLTISGVRLSHATAPTRSGGITAADFRPRTRTEYGASEQL